jgi:phosphatidylethanolamine/phosphatidyl-N-methylethanolamine N-methyltransferase
VRNDTNQLKYKFLAPIYDIMFNPILAKARKKALLSLDFKPNDKILLIGVGTGLDIPLIPKDCLVTGIDLSDDMLHKAKSKAESRNVELYKMNAESLEFVDQWFDYVVLNLILSVAENPKIVISEAIRVLKENGNILVFDKFIKGKKPGITRKLLNILTSFAGTDITRCFEEIAAGLPVSIIKDEGSLFRGNYRIMVLKKDHSFHQE